MQNTSTESIPTQKGEILAQSAVTSPEAFAELYRLYLPQVYRYHLARSGDQSTAQDLTAQTFIAALEGLPGFRGQGSFIAWLMGIARRKLALHYRSLRRHLPLEQADSLPDPADPPDVRVDSRLNLRQLSDALQRLSPDRAEAIRLCVIAELSSAEAALVLGKSQAAVKMLVLRGLRDLRNLCASHLEEAE
ncbi:MAG: RNA polymerase sigma factor [Chloroflexota bacterium]